MNLQIATVFAVVALGTLHSASAWAEAPRFHASAFAARATGGHQEREFGWGGAVLPALELPLTRALGVEVELSALWLAESDPPANPNIAPEGEASAFAAAIGPRFRPFALQHDGTRLSPAGFWLGGAIGATLTNSLWRPMFDAKIGYDFLDRRGRAGMGPALAFQHVFQPDSELRPDDANLIMVGIHALFDFGPGVRVEFDRDHDGIYDEDDRCPEDPEDRDKVEDADGCPDLDDDRDGILDLNDRCPLVPEDKDGFEDVDGCPELDNDKDGIPDTKDKCPNDPEDMDEYQDEDGCPDPDNDADGIPDVKDLCPFEGETVNDYADSDGCPDEEQVRVVGDKIVLDDRVHFMINSHIIRRDSFGLLERLGKLVKDHPEYIHISIEGHADERGAEDFNQRLSDTRAAAVLEFLTKAGVPRRRLSSKGYGSTKPLTASTSEAGYYQNRRVEFIITREARVSAQVPVPPPVPPSLGSDGQPPPEPTPDAAKPVVAPAPAPAPPPPPAPAKAPAPPKPPAAPAPAGGKP